MKVNILIKGYPKEAEKLIHIWQHNCDSINHGIDFITFINKRPNNPKNDNRKIAGLSAKSISYLKDDKELIKMSVENFIYLMVKFGVDIEVIEKNK